MSETFNREQVDDITAPWLNLCKEQEAELSQLREVVEAAKGLCHGTDWNNGTHAKKYRPLLEQAVKALDNGEN